MTLRKVFPAGRPFSSDMLYVTGTIVGLRYNVWNPAADCRGEHIRPWTFSLQYKSFQHFSGEDKVVGKGCSNLTEQMTASPAENKAQQKPGSAAPHCSSHQAAWEPEMQKQEKGGIFRAASCAGSQMQERLGLIILNFTSSS